MIHAYSITRRHDIYLHRPETQYRHLAKLITIGFKYIKLFILHGMTIHIGDLMKNDINI